MNLICPRCGEAWDFDSLHDAATMQNRTYQQVARRFQSKGCEAIGESHTKLSDEERKQQGFKLAAASAIYDVMGDDMDGAASEFDDLGW